MLLCADPTASQGNDYVSDVPDEAGEENVAGEQQLQLTVSMSFLLNQLCRRCRIEWFPENSVAKAAGGVVQCL